MLSGFAEARLCPFTQLPPAGNQQELSDDPEMFLLEQHN